MAGVEGIVLQVRPYLGIDWPAVLFDVVMEGRRGRTKGVGVGVGG